MRAGSFRNLNNTSNLRIVMYNTLAVAIMPWVRRGRGEPEGARGRPGGRARADSQATTSLPVVLSRTPSRVLEKPYRLSKLETELDTRPDAIMFTKKLKLNSHHRAL